MSYLTAADGESESLVAFSDEETVTGSRYEAEIRVDTAESADFGLLVGSQPKNGVYSGVLAFFHTGDGQIQLVPVENGEYGARQTTDLPDIEGEAVVASVDFGENSLVFEIFGVEGRLASVELENPGISAGFGGVYRYHADGDWLINRFRAV